MRFALVGPTIEENLSLACLSGALRAAGHDPRLVPFADDAERPAVVRRLLAAAPDAIGLSMTFQARGHSFLRLAADLRAAGYAGPLVAGGHWASLAATEILRDHPALDAILRGEAERSIVRLVEALAGRGALAGVPGIVLREAGVVREGCAVAEREDLETLPEFARDLPPHAHLGIPWAPILSSRGCRGRCSFCSIAAFHRLGGGPVRRLRAPESVAREMAAQWRERGVRIFVFHDDDFFQGDAAEDLARVQRLGAALRALELPPVALALKARPDDVREDVLRPLLELGLVRLFLGVENHAPAGLRALGRRVGPSENDRALALLRRLGLFACSNLLLFEPDATLPDLQANLALLRDHPDHPFNVGRTELYEGAPLTARLAAQGRLLGDYLGRDYVAADPRVELAWRVFRVALGERCYPLDGPANAAANLGFEAGVLVRFQPGDRAEALRARAAGLMRRLSVSLTMWLERIVGWAASASPGPEAATVAFALDAARAVRAEDARLLAELAGLRRSLERCARGLPEAPAREDGAAAPRRGPGRIAAVAAAAAGLLACTKGSGAARPTPDARDAAAQVVVSPEGAADGGGVAAGDVPAAAAEASEPVDSAAVVLSTMPQHGQWESCDDNARVHAFTLEVRLDDPALAARFDRFEPTDGTIRALYVSPDDRRAHAVLEVGTRRGVQRMSAVYLREPAGSGSIRQVVEFFQYGDGGATLGPEERSASQCGVVCDPMALPPDTLLAADGEVVFGRAPWQPTEGWAQPLAFSVGLREDVEGELVGEPEATCTLGRVLSVEAGGAGAGAGNWIPPGQERMPAVRERRVVQFDPAPAGGSGRLPGGDHTCTVRYRLRQDGTERTVEGTVPVRVDPDGTVRIAPSEGPSARLGPEAIRRAGLTVAGGAPYPELPLPWRYAVDVRCLADYGDTVLLEARCPAADPDAPSFRWAASGGTLEPLDGGRRALWTPPENGAPAVATCAVSRDPLDLQLGSYRRG